MFCLKHNQILEHYSVKYTCTIRNITWLDTNVAYHSQLWFSHANKWTEKLIDVKVCVAPVLYLNCLSYTTFKIQTIQLHLKICSLVPRQIKQFHETSAFSEYSFFVYFYPFLETHHSISMTVTYVLKRKYLRGSIHRTLL